MKRRIEAAAEALGVAQNVPFAGKRQASMAGAALAAADAVMFSDEAVERAAKAVWIADEDATLGFWGNLVDTEREYYRRQVRAVIAALRAES